MGTCYRNCEGCGERFDIEALVPDDESPNYFCARCVVSVLESQHRAAQVRLVVAQQWAVAIACGAREYGVATGTTPMDRGWDDAFDDQIAALAALPCAVDVVAALTGEVPRG